MSNEIYLNPYVWSPPAEKANNQKPVRQDASFDDVLKGKLDIKLSKHAEQRIKDRNINLTGEDADKLNQAVARAQAKGIKSSLILMQDKAFIVSVSSNTIITAVDKQHLADSIFTNIDGAVII
ncbi:TIGR02530 family flagellar biosynthesis protein [Mahella sp.]|uniref:TIGR02530 family flagellar biosynthesis protein n=1 Tax=Mahella sp. TaxID=2798721 RepID=UPI0025C38DAA|nr:TIGR02530 family flagellar biosynthesis protein [Mahella sp.]MBZ4666235.1 flagellar operon protein [Mahella sp.]